MLRAAKPQFLTSRALSTSSLDFSLKAGVKRWRVWGKDYEMTYDQSFTPGTMHRYKNSNSQNANNLFAEPDSWKPALEDTHIRYFVLGTFYRLIYPDDIIIKRRLNNIDISIFVYEYMPQNNTDPNDHFRRGGTQKYAQRKFKNNKFSTDDLRSLYWLKGYAQVIGVDSGLGKLIFRLFFKNNETKQIGDQRALEPKFFNAACQINNYNTFE